MIQFGQGAARCYVDDVLDILCILLGIIPESKEVLNASNLGTSYVEQPDECPGTRVQRRCS
jgi:septum formation inhibitor-activating ATPase MinD